MEGHAVLDGSRQIKGDRQAPAAAQGIGLRRQRHRRGQHTVGIETDIDRSGLRSVVQSGIEVPGTSRGRLGKVHLQIVRGAGCIIDSERRRAVVAQRIGRVEQRNQRGSGARIEVGAHEYLAGRGCRHDRVYGDVRGRGPGHDLALRAGGVCREIPCHVAPVLIDQKARVRVDGVISQLKSAVPRIADLAGLVEAEESLSGDRHIQRVVTRRKNPLVALSYDGNADARTRDIRGRPPGKRSRQHIGEARLRRLESDCLQIRDVVADDVDRRRGAGQSAQASCKAHDSALLFRVPCIQVDSGNQGNEVHGKLLA